MDIINSHKLLLHVQPEDKLSQKKYCYHYSFKSYYKNDEIVVSFDSPELIIGMCREYYKTYSSSFNITLGVFIVDPYGMAKKLLHNFKFTNDHSLFAKGIPVSEPIFHLVKNGDRIELKFNALTNCYSSSIFLYEFELGFRSYKFYGRTFPSIILNNYKEKIPALYLLICHSYMFSKINNKQVKRFFKLLENNELYAKKCAKYNPWMIKLQSDNNIVGKNLDLPKILYWFIKCCDIFKQCNILFNHNIMFGFLSREECEDMLEACGNGTCMIRINSETKLVISSKISDKYFHGYLESEDLSLEESAIKLIKGNNINSILCSDGVNLPKVNFFGLFKAEGIKV